MKRYLVLGAGGFIGKALCLKLSENNYIRAFDFVEVAEMKNITNVDLVTGDFTGDVNFSKLLEGIDVVIHLISTTIPTDDTSIIPDEIKGNIIPTVKLLESMVTNNVKDIIFASSGGTVYGEKGSHNNKVGDALEPISSYGVQKMVIEAYLQFYGRVYGIRYKIARISNPYGMGQDPLKIQGVIPIFINRLIANQDIKVFGDGESKRDYIYLEDLVEGLLRLDQYEGSQCIFNIGTGETHTLKEIISIIERTVQKNFSNIEYEPKRQHDVTETILDVEDTFGLLNWYPKVKMQDGIQRIYKQMSSNNGEDYEKY